MPPRFSDNYQGPIVGSASVLARGLADLPLGCNDTIFERGWQIIDHTDVDVIEFLSPGGNRFKLTVEKFWQRFPTRDLPGRTLPEYPPWVPPSAPLWPFLVNERLEMAIEPSLRLSEPVSIDWDSVTKTEVLFDEYRRGNPSMCSVASSSMPPRFYRNVHVSHLRRPPVYETTSEPTRRIARQPEPVVARATREVLEERDEKNQEPVSLVSGFKRKLEI